MSSGPKRKLSDFTFPRVIDPEVPLKKSRENQQTLKDCHNLLLQLSTRLTNVETKIDVISQMIERILNSSPSQPILTPEQTLSYRPVLSTWKNLRDESGKNPPL